MRIDNQPAFILHTRPYRDSSLLVECVTAQVGRISGVVKGVRGTGRTARQRRSLMQPFIPLSIGWSGNTDLKSIMHYEALGPAPVLVGERLYSALYINELYVRLLQPYDENPHWFALYQQAIGALQQAELIDVELRCFELHLLEALGYGLDFSGSAPDGAALQADQQYRFDAEQGFVAVAGAQPPGDVPSVNLFAGTDLLAIAEGHFNDSARRAAKRLCRQALAIHLGDKPLKSRELFAKSTPVMPS